MYTDQDLENLGIALFVLACILAIIKYAKGFVSKSGILLTAVSAVLLNLSFNGAKADDRAAIDAVRHAQA